MIGVEGVGVYLLVLVWTSGLVGEVVGSDGGWACPLLPVPLWSHISLYPFTYFPYPFHIILPTAHIQLMPSIYLLASYCGILGLGSGIRPSLSMRSAGLAMRLVAFRKWRPECCLPCLAGVISRTTIQGLWQQCLSFCHRTRMGDLSLVAVGARKRQMVLVPLKSIPSWWPADDDPKDALILVVSVNKVMDLQRIGMLSFWENLKKKKNNKKRNIRVQKFKDIFFP